jgi:hypothetical protein
LIKPEMKRSAVLLILCFSLIINLTAQEVISGKATVHINNKENNVVVPVAANNNN